MPYIVNPSMFNDTYTSLHPKIRKYKEYLKLPLQEKAKIMLSKKWKNKQSRKIDFQWR